MNVRLSMLALASASALLFAGCGGGSHEPLPNTTSAPVSPYTGPQSLANFTWGAPLMAQAQYVGPASIDSLSVDVQVKPQNLPGLLQYAQMASDPKSPLYRHFLTPQQIGASYGASAPDYAAAAAYFAKYHLGVAGWPQHLTMVVSGKQSDIEAAFGTKLGVFREFGRTFVAPSTQPHFSKQVPVTGVLGLVHLNLDKTFLIRPGNGNYFGMSVPQLRRAFDFTGAAGKGFDGSGITVGVIGTGPISLSDVPLLAKVDNVPAPPAINIVAALPQPASALNNNTGTAPYDPNPSGLATPPPVTAPCNQLGTSVVSANCNPEDGEAQLDTEQLSLLAPGAAVNFYLAYNAKDCTAFGAPTGCLGIEGLFVNDDEIQQAIADNAVDALSLSFGLPEASAAGAYFDTNGSGVGPAEFAALKAEGIAVFVSSGDNGAHDCTDSNGVPTAQFCPDYPATDPSVVAVGGVNYPMDSYGNLPPGAQITAWATNSTLGGDGIADNSAGSGGGISAVFPAPQSQSALPATIQGSATGGKRTIPDISMMGDPLTGVQLVTNAAYPKQAGIGAAGGTSAAAPEMTAAWAIVLQACKVDAKCATAMGAHPWRLGDPKALLYQIYGSTSQYGSTIYDVLAGNNGNFSDPCAATPCATPTPGQYFPGYSAGKGYDLVTGLGVPFIGHLVNTVVSDAGGASPNAP